MHLRHKLMGTVAALAIGFSPMAASAVELTLFHTWSNESEMAALNTIIDAFTKNTGNTVKTASVPHEELGVQAWSRMRSLVRHETPEHNVLFQPRLELRRSTAAPRRSTPPASRATSRPAPWARSASR